MSYMVSIEQWQAFVAVVKENGYVNASLKLNKTQPSISYAIQKMEELLDVKLFEMQGRKSTLTKTGKELYFYAVKLVQLANDLEQKAKGKINQIEQRIRLVVDEIFPVEILMRTLAEFSRLAPDTTILVTRGILSGPCDKIEKDEADIAITFKHPINIISEAFFETTSSIYVSNHHKLAKLNRIINQTDLISERQIIIMDSNKNSSIDYGWLNLDKAWYVDSLELKLQMINYGLGYAWLNDNLVNSRQYQLTQLQLDMGKTRKHKLYLAYRDRESLGERMQLLIKLLKQN